MKKLRFVADDGSGTYERVRLGSRAILMKDGKLLLVHELATGYYSIPGGGHEEGETLEETCVREIAEEVGIKVKVMEEKAVVESLWKEKIFENHFFVCEYDGETSLNLTEREASMELRPEWVTLVEAKAIFDDPSVVEKGAKWLGCYKRDSWILKEIVDELK